jgi:hypothetical protein
VFNYLKMGFINNLRRFLGTIIMSFKRAEKAKRGAALCDKGEGE